MHSQNILHKDLKPHNIFLHFPNVGWIEEYNSSEEWEAELEKAKKNWDASKPIEVKIGDFGLAAKVRDDKKKISKDPVKFAEIESFKGTAPFMCPEKNLKKQKT